jgi:prevent-host-death family protein
MIWVMGRPPTKVAIYELKRKLSRYIRAVETGDEVTITSHGRPVARLVPPAETPGLRVRRGEGDGHAVKPRPPKGKVDVDAIMRAIRKDRF